MTKQTEFTAISFQGILSHQTVETATVITYLNSALSNIQQTQISVHVTKTVSTNVTSYIKQAPNDAANCSNLLDSCETPVRTFQTVEHSEYQFHRRSSTAETPANVKFYIKLFIKFKFFLRRTKYC